MAGAAVSSRVMAGSTGFGVGKPPQNNFKLKYAPHIGMFKNSAGDDPIDQIKFMADMGFTALEDNGMMGRTPELQKKMGDEMARLGMTMGVFVVDKGGNGQNTLAAGKTEFIDIFLKGLPRSGRNGKARQRQMGYRGTRRFCPEPAHWGSDWPCN